MSICDVVLAFTANKQTNNLNYIRIFRLQLRNYGWVVVQYSTQPILIPSPPLLIQGYQVSPCELEEMGQCLCEALLQMGGHRSSDAEKQGQPEGTQERTAR